MKTVKAMKVMKSMKAMKAIKATTKAMKAMKAMKTMTKTMKAMKLSYWQQVCMLEQDWAKIRASCSAEKLRYTQARAHVVRSMRGERAMAEYVGVVARVCAR